MRNEPNLVSFCEYWEARTPLPVPSIDENGGGPETEEERIGDASVAMEAGTASDAGHLQHRQGRRGRVHRRERWRAGRAASQANQTAVAQIAAYPSRSRQNLDVCRLTTYDAPGRASAIDGYPPISAMPRLRPTSCGGAKCRGGPTSDSRAAKKSSGISFA